MSTNQAFHTEISIIPAGTGSTGVSKEVAAAFDAIRKIKDIRSIALTPMGTQIEINDMTIILKAIEVAHQAVRSPAVNRIISVYILIE